MHGLQATDNNLAIQPEKPKKHMLKSATSLYNFVSHAKTYLDILNISADISIPYQ